MRRWPLASLAAMCLLAGAAWAAPAPPGASSCSGCHLPASSVRTPIPALTGRSALEIAGIMREFKSGGRPGTVMGRVAKGFSDAEIDAIAEWIAKRK